MVEFSARMRVSKVSFAQGRLVQAAHFTKPALAHESWGVGRVRGGWGREGGHHELYLGDRGSSPYQRNILYLPVVRTARVAYAVKGVSGMDIEAA
jgi:hypothetical protein